MDQKRRWHRASCLNWAWTMRALDEDRTIGPEILSESDIAGCIERIAGRINRDYRARRPVLVVGILKGASLFTADLVRALDFPLTLSYVTISSYGASTVNTGGPRLTQDLDLDPRGQHVLVVEDVIDTGKTLNHLHRHLLDRGALSVESVVLLDLQKDKTTRQHLPKYVGAETDAEWVCGYGIDYKEQYRNLRGIVRVQAPELS